MLTTRLAERWLADERGFTLVELLVATAAGVLVLFAASTIMIVSLRLTSRVTDRVQAVQQARTSMEQVIQELNSGCLTNDVSPVQATTTAGVTPAVSTDGSHLVFVSGVGDSATATPTLHVLSVRSGSLIDTSYANTGGSPPALNIASTWTFSTTPTGTRTLLQHVSQIDASTPYFQYLAYPASSGAIGSTPLSPLPLSGSAAASVAEVDIAWVAAPSDGLTDASRVIAMRDSAVFRFTPANATGTNFPCD
jgi:prepilin-type N-terminal cleavage/methylation domain-containing protein